MRRGGGGVVEASHQSVRCRPDPKTPSPSHALCGGDQDEMGPLQNASVSRSHPPLPVLASRPRPHKQKLGAAGAERTNYTQLNPSSEAGRLLLLTRHLLLLPPPPLLLLLLPPPLMLLPPPPLLLLMPLLLP
ncbi:unnamed protein product [Lampetra planeri]